MKSLARMTHTLSDISASAFSKLARVSAIVIVMAAMGSLTGIAVAAIGFDIRQLVGFLLGVLFLVIILGPERNLRAGFYLWVLSFAVGFRSLQLTRDLRFGLAETMAWLLVLTLFSRQVFRREKIGFGLPLHAWGLAALAFVWLISGINNGISADVQIFEFKNLVLFIPVFALVRNYVSDAVSWRKVFITCCWIAILIAGPALISYYFPVTRDLLGGPTLEISGTDSFQRAAFALYGTTLASVYLVLFLPLASACFLQSIDRRSKILWGTSILLSIWGVYASGYRALWLALGLAVIVFAVFGGGKSWIVLALVAGAIAALPSVFYDRLVTTLAVLDPTVSTDASMFKHLAGTQGAIDLLSAHPLGNGWGVVGWTYNETIQLGVSLGIPGLALFLLWYANVMIRTVAKAHSESDPQQRLVSAAFVAMLTAFIVILTSHPVLHLPETAVVMWFFLALATQWLANSQVPVRSAPSPWSETRSSTSI